MSSRDSSIKTGRPAAAKADLKGRRILVVEDSPVVGPFTADLLERCRRLSLLRLACLRDDLTLASLGA